MKFKRNNSREYCVKYINLAVSNVKYFIKIMYNVNFSQITHSNTIYNI